nr:hypothetical protein [Tanacetum cinerariifolium]
SFSDEDFLKKIYSNPLFDEEIIHVKIDQHPFNAESDLIESMPNHDSLITISLKIDSHFDEFADELTLLKSISPGIDKTDCYPEEDIHLEKSPDLLSHQGLEAFQPSAECPMIINEKNIPLLDVPLFYFYPP